MKSGLSFEQLEREYNERKVLISGVESERAELVKKLEDIDKRLQSFKNGTAPTSFVQNNQFNLAQSGPAVRSAKSSRSPAKNRVKITDMAYNIFRQFRKNMTLSEISDELLRRGAKTISKRETFISSVGSMMYKDSRFFNYGKGVWGLTEAK
jgi:hypothetical protein